MSKHTTSCKDIDLIIFKKIYSFFYINRIRTYVVFILLVVSYLITKIPYVNLVFISGLMWPIAVILVFYVYNVTSRIALYVCVSLFIVGLFFTIWHMEAEAELIGNVIFFLIWYIWLKYFRNYLRKIK